MLVGAPNSDFGYQIRRDVGLAIVVTDSKDASNEGSVKNCRFLQNVLEVLDDILLEPNRVFFRLTYEGVVN